MKKIAVLSVGLTCLAVSAGIEQELGKKFLPAASDMLTFTTISQKLHEMDVEADLAWTKPDGFCLPSGFSRCNQSPQRF